MSYHYTLFGTRQVSNWIAFHFYFKSLLRDGTVIGQMEGNAENVNMMKSWLQNTGSPQSKIQRAEFRNQREVQQYSFDPFKIIR